MPKPFLLLFTLSLLTWNVNSQNSIADSATYLTNIKSELNKEWPKNRTINLVFHGHSVPAGFFKTPLVNTLKSYPYLLLKELKNRYPFAVINIINTAIGGENSERGERRFDREVLNHNPNILFIDYALNDRGVGLEKSKKYWSSMIQKALKNNIKIILLTPTPDQQVDILQETSELASHRQQIINLAKENNIGIVDSYGLFKEKVSTGESISTYMSQVNHPNEKGHQLITDEIIKYF